MIWFIIFVLIALLVLSIIKFYLIVSTRRIAQEGIIKNGGKIAELNTRLKRVEAVMIERGMI